MMPADDDYGTNNRGQMPGGIGPQGRKPIDPYIPGKRGTAKFGTGPSAGADKNAPGSGSSKAGMRGTGPGSASHDGDWDSTGPRTSDAPRVRGGRRSGGGAMRTG
jgi:hypothetical protein